MITLTIEISDDKVHAISTAVKSVGGNIIDISHDDDLSDVEFKLLQESYKESLQIQAGKIEAIPVSELWND